jgi:glycogen debranching enzyme
MPIPATDVIEVGDHFYIRAQSSLADSRTLVLLHGDTFAVFDRHGNIQAVGSGQQGIFHQETRHLSLLELRICGFRPLLLSSAVREDNILLGVDLTNPDLELPSGESLLRGTLHIHRKKFLSDGACFNQIAVHNYGQKTVNVELSFAFGADFADIFEVRGQKRTHRGVRLPEKIDRSSVTLAYQGLDQVLRHTRIECSPLCCVVRASEIFVPMRLAPQQETVFSLNIICERDGATAAFANYEKT